MVKAVAVSRRGFTLIELLVVIAIVGLLASILFPVFSRARENARKTVCINKLKQIGLGIMIYVQDYDEVLPLALDERKAMNLRSVWNTMTVDTSYLATAVEGDALDCPSDKTRIRYTDYQGYWWGRYKNTAYCWNKSAGYVNSSGVSVQPLRALSDLSKPSLDMLVFEADGGVGSDIYYHAVTYSYVPFINLPLDRHSGGLNCLFVDGHVGWYNTGKYNSDLAGKGDIN